MINQIRSKPPIWVWWLCILLLFPALLINLGLLTHIDDEAIRALVALEMKYSGNWITPTLLGTYYYNKPPLFNWILAVFFEIAGTHHEFISRLVTVVALFGYGGTIFYFFQKYYTTSIGFLTAFVTITCGRILFWDSILGLIDITFSWVIFSLFMTVYQLFEKRRFLALFLITYLLTAIGFMLKGLPALVFQAITLLTYFTYRNHWRLLFSWKHIVGILLLFTLLSTYYYGYQQYHSLDQVFVTLFTESSKRTAVRFGFWPTVVHFISFPFEMVYHFLPWSLLIFYLFQKEALKRIKQDPFAQFLGITFVSNVLIYWTSPEVYPRYLLMLAPLIFGFLLVLHQYFRQKNTLIYRILYYTFGITMIIISIGSITPLFLPRVANTPFLYTKTVLLILGCATITWLYWRSAYYPFAMLTVFLLVVRIGFNWFVLPDRNQNDYGDLCRQSSIKVGQAYRDSPLYIYGDTEIQPTNAFYLTRARGQIIYRDSTLLDRNAYYIIGQGNEKELSFEKIDSFFVRHGQLTYYLGKIKY